MDEHGREDHPEWYREPLAQLARVQALLDALGWSEVEAPAELTIDAAEHGAALGEAVDNALAVAVDDLKEAEGATRETAARRVRVLGDFAKDIERSILLRAGNDPRVQALHESAEQLLAELDAEGGDYS